MSLFDKLKNQAVGAVNQAVQGIPTGGKTVSVVFPAMPETLAAFAALPQAAMQNPFDTAALVAAALCVYPQNKDGAIAMLNFLKGPQPLSQREVAFIAERMSQNNKAGYIGASYLQGATPQNNYVPTQPYTVNVIEDPYSYQDQGYAGLKIRSGGADSPRPVKLRQAKDGKWYLWEQHLLADIRPPESTNPWA